MHTSKGIPLWGNGNQALLEQAMEIAPDRCGRALSRLREQFDRDGSLKRLGIDVVGEGRVHDEGTFTNVAAIDVADQTIETKRLGPGWLCRDPLHKTASSLELPYTSRCAEETKGEASLLLLSAAIRSPEAQQRLVRQRAKDVPGLGQAGIHAKTDVERPTLECLKARVPRNVCT